MPQEGMLFQLDGSHHAWLVLLLAVDDATGTVPYALSRNRRIPEAICPYFRASLKGGESPWRFIPMGMPSFSPGARGGIGPVVVGLPNGLGLWGNWE